MAPPSTLATLGVFIRDTGTIVAGLSAETYCGWLYINYLWLRDDLRGRGIGRELIARAEARALERDCHSAWLDTFSFQARGFYEKPGYEEFGTVDDPPAHKQHLTKTGWSQRNRRAIRVFGAVHSQDFRDCSARSTAVGPTSSSAED